MGGRGGSSGMGGGGGAQLGPNAREFDGISNLPNKIDENQRWVLEREYQVRGTAAQTEFEGKSTYGSSNYDIVAQNAGWKTTASLKNAYKERTAATKVGDIAWTGKMDSSGNMIWDEVIKNTYKPVLVTLRGSR